MLKVALVELNINAKVSIDNEIKALKYKIVTFTPEQILIDKGIEPASLNGWNELNETSKYRHAENAQNVKLLSNILSGLKRDME